MTNIITIRRNRSAQSEDKELLLELFSAQLSIVLLLFWISPVCKQESSAQTPIIIIIIIIIIIVVVIEPHWGTAVTVRLMKVEAQTGVPHLFSKRFLAMLLKCVYENICNPGIEKQTYLCGFHATVMLWELIKPHNSFFRGFRMLYYKKKIYIYT